jgi:hypothetical protein
MTAAIQRAWLVALAGVTLIVCGCAAPTQRLSDEDRAKFKTARIDASVERVAQPFLLAPSGANIGMMFGAIGGAVTGSVAEENTKAFSAFLDKNAISIEKIVREEVEGALRESGKLAVTSAADASAPSIKIAVQQYGFGVTHLLSSNVVPVLMIKCDMVDGSGRVLWSAGDRMLPSIASPMQPTTWEDLRANPARIEEEWRKASRHLARNILNEL